MIKKLSIAAVVLTSGCHLEKPYVYPLDIFIKDNAPCFAVPADRQKKGDLVLNRGVIISRLTGGKWVNIWHSDPQPPFTIIPAGQCVSYPEINWQPGDYSVLMTIASERDDEKFRLVNTIRLQKNRAGYFSLQNIQQLHD
ncbi:putative T6SS immunity periplasmic lipoprotein [Kalamiella sp. sgz302252]|uniref:putative T6SS immunity periplasmic lipoprotein n=1 Tax=Pantoea sp. sgz302252 TaxID=3341827 RepID=UPI0036D404FC